MDERASLLERLAAIGASESRLRTCRDAPLDQLRRTVASSERVPRPSRIEDVWRADSADYAEAERRGLRTGD